jgi:hypothetical protein
LANTYTLNGITASLAPYSVRWRDVVVGTDHDGRNILGGYKEIDLEFESASVTFFKQWNERASSGSLNMDVLEQAGLGYKSLSSVFMNVTNFPAVEGTYCTPFGITVTRATVS